MSSFNSIALLGHNGQLGKKAVAALAATGVPLKILHRAGSNTETIPKGDNVTAVTIDFDDEESLVKALTGTDILLSLVGAAGLSSQLKLIPAAKKAGVKLFAPSEYGALWAKDEAKHVPFLQTKEDVLDAVQESGLGWARVVTAGFVEYFFGTPAAGIDVKGNAVTHVGNSASNKFASSSLDYIAKSLAAIFPTTPISEVSNRVIGIQEYSATGTEIAQTLTKLHGVPTKETTVSEESVEAALADGGPKALVALLKLKWSRDTLDISKYVIKTDVPVKPLQETLKQYA